MRSLGIIPARYESTRFPGKTLIVIDGKSMIQRVFEQACKCKDLSKVVVATDHQSILNHVREFGGDVILTATSHRTGTERCAEAFAALQARGEEDFDVVVNIQGDEPFIFPEQISEVVSCFSDPAVAIATLARRIRNPEDVTNPNVVKVVFDENLRVLYFSRAAIPHVREGSIPEKERGALFYEHVGIYGFRQQVLRDVVKLPESALEKAEALEQLRWLQHGMEIFVRETDYPSISIDVPEDLLKITNRKS